VCLRFFDQQQLSGGLPLSDPSLEGMLKHADIQDVVQAQAIATGVQIGESIAGQENLQTSRNICKRRFSESERNSHGKGPASRIPEGIA
jgi:hypothetical protein